MEQRKCGCWAALVNSARKKKQSSSSASVSASNANSLPRTSLVYNDDAVFIGRWPNIDFLSNAAIETRYLNASNRELSAPPEVDEVAAAADVADKKPFPQLLQFTFQELKSATGNFRPDSILGEGGFGFVFKGWIEENGTAPAKPGTGVTVAVKSLKPDGLQGHREWVEIHSTRNAVGWKIIIFLMQAEVDFLGQLHHPNLVKLIGYCIEDDQRLLVYEFMPRGSLENHLFRILATCFAFVHGPVIQVVNPLNFIFGRQSWKELPILITYHPITGSVHVNAEDICCIIHDLADVLATVEGALPLPWSSRVKIALGAAKGLAFLHGGAEPVIYRDFKTSNILLDAEYNAKLSDFGLAKAGPQGDNTHVSTRVVGTYGYAAPEYVMTGRRSVDKKRPSREQNLVAWARPYLSDKRKLYQLVDPRLELNYSIKGVQKVAQMAYCCLSRDPKSRPLMDEVVKGLTPLQDLNDFAILSVQSRSQQGRRKKKSEANRQPSNAQLNSIKGSPFMTCNQHCR
ncbi:hypothetical protein ACLOJK_003888 [Asimina triloba]